MKRVKDLHKFNVLIDICIIASQALLKALRKNIRFINMTLDQFPRGQADSVYRRLLTLRENLQTAYSVLNDSQHPHDRLHSIDVQLERLKEQVNNNE